MTMTASMGAALAAAVVVGSAVPTTHRVASVEGARVCSVNYPAQKSQRERVTINTKTSQFDATQGLLIDSALVSLYDSGLTYDTFLDGARLRRQGWLDRTESAAVPDELVARANAVAGTWRLLVVAFDGCGDSMNQVPFVAKLAAQVNGLEIRIVNPGQGRAVREAHRSLDGRIATPTYVLIDTAGNESGCIVELPTALRRWSHEAREGGVSLDSIHGYQSTFYDTDRGVAITTEIVELLEAAAAGTPRCERGGAS